MINFIVTLNGYGHFLKEEFKGRALFEYAPKENFQALTSQSKWGYINLDTTFEKSYFKLFADETDFPGESYIRSITCPKFPDEVKTFFIGEFLTHNEGKVIEGDLKFSDKELYELLKELSDEGKNFFFNVYNGQVIIGFKNNFPIDKISHPKNLQNKKFVNHLFGRRELKEVDNLIIKSSTMLFNHPVNKVREDLSEPIGNLLWLWGMGKKKDISPFSSKIGKDTYFLATNNNLNGLPHSLGFKEVSDVSQYEKNSLLWINNSLNELETPSMWVKKFQKLDQEILGQIKEISSGRDCRILFIFDSFINKNTLLNNKWGVYCSIVNPSSKFIRFRKYIKNSSKFIESFLS